ncbi:DNase I-like protein [Jaminaea rosea]|uniref:DNA-(apurinic or apyrimidinic site) endonuclease n=1 Tax=Jaminaea rosea TaxID=1569628 RepID=A0A316V2B9_9BASI|nr:DNase I-like protein [Jaminaea rosea]PWN31148.1 DNase I-like protein [Jaminaea rosea]
MRILTWNVNGLRKLRTYQPFSLMKSWHDILSHLQADIVCLQETKLTRKQALEDKEMCLPSSSWESYWDFHPSRGYSGTAVYTRGDIARPLHFERGLTGAKGRDGIGGYAGDYEDFSIDEEGRAVVLDFGLFVLFNLYCPVMGSEERHDFRMAFYSAVNERARALLAAGRNVIIVGDINIARQPIDHCDYQGLGGDGPADGDEEFYSGSQARSWLDRFIHPKGPFHDVQREAHPQRKGMYTCWSTLKNARPTNYGTRIDYTLVSSGLKDWVKGADIQAEVPGSDHCPVWVDLWDEREVGGKVLKLRDAMSQPTSPPMGAASRWDEFRVKGLKSFFDKAAASAATAGIARATGSTSPSPVKSIAISPPAASPPPKVNGSSPPASIPKPAKATATSPKAIKAATTTASKKAAASRQQLKLASFFGAPASSSSSTNEKKRLPACSPTEIVDGEGSTKKRAKLGLPAENGHVSRSEEAGTAPADRLGTGEEDEEVDWEALAALPDPDAPPLPNPNANANANASSASAWSSILTPPSAPKCPAHGEPARAWTVNKPGPNHGRKFFLCSREVGVGYEKGFKSTKGGGEGGEYRCGFFMWGSEWGKRRKAGGRGT